MKGAFALGPSSIGRRGFGLFGVGTQELLVVFLVILILFGADKIPEAARTFGKSVRYFKKAAEDIEGEIQQVVREKDALIGNKKRLSENKPGGVGPSRSEPPSPEAQTKEHPAEKAE
jgi:sec-independent protein translocase protein TatA